MSIGAIWVFDMATVPRAGALSASGQHNTGNLSLGNPSSAVIKVSQCRDPRLNGADLEY